MGDFEKWCAHTKNACQDTKMAYFLTIVDF
jgi:hypothetical protein